MSLVIPENPSVGNIRCGGNDVPLGFYAAKCNSLGGDRMYYAKMKTMIDSVELEEGKT